MRTTTRDMTQGSILKHLILFAFPLMVGNVFQLLYNTVDALIVGNYVGKQALAAVGSTTMIINVLVFFFNGLSVGAGVVISQFFGAKQKEALHISVETTIALTFAVSVLFTIIGVLGVNPMLRLMSTPEDVFDEAAIYLRIYFAGIAGLLIYNMGSGILRAVGNTMSPLLFLVFTSVVNIVLDMVFVLVLQLGIAGVAYATVISQLVSAVLVMLLLCRTHEIYRVTWHDLRVDKSMALRILKIGLPTGIQAMVTSFSNVFVQSYVNVFGSDCMAGWSCYNRLDPFVFLPTNALGSAATTFVGQNYGAGDLKRADKGIVISVVFSEAITFLICGGLYLFAGRVVRLFSPDRTVIDYGVMFLRMNVFFMLFNCVNHTLAGGLRGRGDSQAPMIIMLSSFVVTRQIYLYVVTNFIVNNEHVVGFSYPVGWMTCCAVELLYFYIRYVRKQKAPTRV